METSLEQCPLCGSELSQIKVREIRGKLRDQEQKKAAELAGARLAIRSDLEAEFKKQFEQQKHDAEKKIKEEAEQRVKKAVAEREQVALKLKVAEAREVEIRRQSQEEIERQKQAAEKKAKADSELKVKKLTFERDQAAKKLKEAEAREVEIRTQEREEADKLRQKELLDQRQVLDKDKKLALLKQQSEFNRERESLQKKLERKTPNELGDGGEINVFEALREAFDGNSGKTTRIPKGENGADILHEVFYKGELCGRIIVDAKNRQSWQNVFVTKLRGDRVEAGAEHAILATTVFPAGKREMCIESDVIVISPARVVQIIELLRRAMVTMHVKGLSMKERTSKMSCLYRLITSEAHTAKFTEANRLTQDMLELEVQEKTTHDNVWKKRGALVKRIHNILREVETEVAAVIEGDEEAEQAPPISDSRALAMKSAS